MVNIFKRAIKKMVNVFGFGAMKLAANKQNPFNVYHYQRHTRRRLEHLASLGLDIAGSTVLEVGGGAGDLTDFYIDRGCRIVTSDARQDNINFLRTRYPHIKALKLDMDFPPDHFNETYDIVHCYGLLYHLKDPKKALDFLSRCCHKMLFLCTCVSHGNDDAVHLMTENKGSAFNSIHGEGCRPTRQWIYNQLKRNFEFVYLPINQPNHEEFPIDWSLPARAKYSRAIFIASRTALNNRLLKEEIPMKQIRAN